MPTTDVSEFFSDLDAGVFEQKLSRALSDVAAGVIDNHAEGQVIIKMNLKQIGGSNTVNIKHSLTFKKPTINGDVTEKDITETPMHVGAGGRMTLFPENQEQMFDKHGQISQTDHQS